MSRHGISIVLIVLGVLSIVGAAALVGYNMWDDQRAQEAVYDILVKMEEVRRSSSPAVNGTPDPQQPSGGEPAQSPGEAPSQTTPAAPGEPGGNSGSSESPSSGGSTDTVPEMPSVQIDRFRYIGTVQIPAIGLELPVVDDWGYPQLKVAPCRYSGSVYQQNLVICGHNYSSHFGRLKNLQQGDSVVFMDMNGTVYRYKVAKIENLQRTDVREMESGGWALTLFTCTTSGIARVAVRCQAEG